MTSDVEQGVDDNYQREPTLRNLHRGFFGQLAEHTRHHMDIVYAATEAELKRANECLLEDISDLHLQLGSSEDDFDQQLAAIASDGTLRFAIGLDAGTLLQWGGLGQHCFK